jgi:hypothetical protein
LGSLWAVLKGYRKSAGKSPNTRCQPIGKKAELPSGYWEKRGNPFLFSEVLRFCSHLLKVEGPVEILKMFSSSSPIFALSNHTTFSQTQTGATVPLRDKGLQLTSR